jgi:hypothetical protein
MGWIGVDFDGTLATDADSSPIPAMVERVKRWLSQGIEVKILTARVNKYYLMDNEGKRDDEAQAEVDVNTAYIAEWCRAVFGKVLPTTCSKDCAMYQLYDDRAVQVIKDTGERVGNINRKSDKYIGETIIDEESGFVR